MSERRFHTDSRAGENFTKDGLETLTGQPSRKWGRYAVKELVDNAIEAAEQTDDPAVSVDVDVEGRGRLAHARRVTVSDNGPGIPEDRLRQIADVERFGGTKRHYALPSRGTQGNALMTLLGIQYLADGGPLTIESHGSTYEFHVDDNTIDAVPSVELTRGEPTAAADGGTGTAVSVEFGDAGKKWAKTRPIFETLNGFATLNPHVRFEINGQDTTPADDTTNRFEPKGKAVGGRALWFDRSAFRERLKADIRADAEVALSEFIREFDGLASRSKRDAVLNAAGLDGDATLTETFVSQRNEFDEFTVGTLLTAMQTETGARSEDNLHKTLGSVGKALRHGPRTLLEHYGIDIGDVVDDLRADGTDVETWRGLSTYYRASDAVETDEHRIPFVFELATVAVPSDTLDGVQMNFGINGSVSYSSPYATVTFDDVTRERNARSIRGAFNDLAHPFVVVSNLTCPNIPFQDKGKQQFPTEPFEAAISDVVGKTVRKYQRDIRPELNEFEQTDEPEKPTLPDEKKAPRGFIKKAVFDLLEPVYNDATEGGDYSIMMRQLFYELRPRFHALADRKGYEYSSRATINDPTPIELNYDTFTDYVDQYEREVLEERIVRRDDRGFFVEPHSNERIQLSTQKVNQYDPTDAVSVEFDTLLFVEKTGFYEQLHRDFEITKRYDVGLINAQGYSTTAIRNFVEKVKRANPEVEYLTLTDLDIGGLGIATDADDPDPLSALTSFDAHRLGVTAADVQRFDLEVESVDYASKDETKLESHYDAGDIGKAEYEFVRAGNRVEINAFSPTELKQYVETKLNELGVSKITPEPADVETPDVDSWEHTQETAIKRAIGEYVLQQIDDDLIDALADHDDAVAIPDDNEQQGVDTSREAIHDELSSRLDERPAESWREVNEQVVDEISEPLEDAQERYQNTAEQSVHDILSKTGFVSVDADAVK